MKCGVAGAGAISAAGANRVGHQRTYLSGAKRWSVHSETGLPVYGIASLPRVTAIEKFVAQRSPDRSSVLAIHAAHEAVLAAGWADSEFAVLVGCSRGPTAAWESHFRQFELTGASPVRSSPSTTLGSIGFAVADFFGGTSLASGLSVTCSSGLHALLHGVALLQSNMVDRVLVGGTEASLTTFTLRQMEALRVYAQPAPSELYACRPLTDPPSGMVVGEGAAFLALERVVPNQHPFSVKVGFAREQVASATGISSGGRALQQAMHKAIDGSVPDAIIAHAPGTRRGDAAERAAVHAIFGAEAPPLTSLKWATGHTFGASGPLAVVAALDMLADRIVWPPYFPDRPVGVPNSLLVNATGFGGNATSVLIERNG